MRWLPRTAHRLRRRRTLALAAGQGAPGAARRAHARRRRGERVRGQACVECDDHVVGARGGLGPHRVALDALLAEHLWGRACGPTFGRVAGEPPRWRRQWSKLGQGTNARMHASPSMPSDHSPSIEQLRFGAPTKPGRHEPLMPVLPASVSSGHRASNAVAALHVITMQGRRFGVRGVLVVVVSQRPPPTVSPGSGTQPAYRCTPSRPRDRATRRPRAGTAAAAGRWWLRSRGGRCRCAPSPPAPPQTARCCVAPPCRTALQQCNARLRERRGRERSGMDPAPVGGAGGARWHGLATSLHVELSRHERVGGGLPSGT